MRSPIFKNLDEDFDAEELNPVWKEGTQKDGGSSEAIEDLVDKLPEQMSIKFRQAAMEAVVEAIVEDAEDENPEITEAEIKEELDPVIDKAVTLHLVPSTIKTRITRMLADRYKMKDPRVKLLERAARYMTDAAIEVVEENGLKSDDPVIEKELDFKPADEGTDVTDETIVPEVTAEKEDGNGGTTGTVPTAMANSMKRLAKHSIAQRRAMAQVIHRGAGAQLARMLDDLKHHLPEKFKTKYRVK